VTICPKEQKSPVVSAAVSITSTRTGKRSISLQALASPRDLLKPRGVPSYVGWSPKVKSTDIANKVREVARRYPEFHPYTISLKMEVLFGIKVGPKRIKQILNGEES
tara:strand:- start:336 stop:656 length:321 start_codon:yes stop_codon:yes gene_type:complete